MKAIPKIEDLFNEIQECLGDEYDSFTLQPLKLAFEEAKKENLDIKSVLEYFVEQFNVGNLQQIDSHTFTHPLTDKVMFKMIDGKIMLDKALKT